MKKLLCLSVLAALCVTGCASTGTSSTASSANQMLTLDEALQKSAETRQKLQQAKESYEAAKAAANSSAASTATDLGNAAQQQKVDDANGKIEAEKEAWKEALNYFFFILNKAPVL